MPLFRLLLICSALLTSACKLLPTNGDSESSQSLVIAHRAASGSWHQNSRNAVEQTLNAFSQGSLKQRIHGIELDIVLTQDNVPVLSHDPWVHKTLCTKKDGSPVDHQLIRDISFRKLSEDYLCGGIIDPEFPNAATKAESILGFDELLELLTATPTLAVYLDIKVEAATTQSAEAYAKAIFQRWQQAQLPNALYMEGPTAAALAAYARYSAGTAYTPVLSYPPFYSHTNWTKVGAEAAVKTLLKPGRAVEKAQQAEASAVVMHTAVFNQQALRALHADNKQLVIFIANTQQDLDKYCDAGVDLIITDFPHLGPCP